MCVCVCVCSVFAGVLLLGDGEVRQTDRDRNKDRENDRGRRTDDRYEVKDRYKDRESGCVVVECLLRERDFLLLFAGGNH